ncbi:vacuolar protein sorting protein [Mucor ambiguus]|uniref:Vacuolar protein-sorting-associated protein 36 n=1 Tax=Mucor ambiguus TaxID=91626 RepID=A0A0C9MIN8_9FUNG|nr:vacuolar protein sorting protein [Mucor ambiguus]
MEFFKSTILSSAKRPELVTDESLLIQQGNIGLYDGKHKVDQYQDGVCYLTSRRIIYVDNKNPLESSVELGLHLVKDIESYSGFLRSSPKIIINIDPVAATAAAAELSVGNGSSHSLNASNSNGNVWACPICFFSNKASSEMCELCGVRKQADATSPSIKAPVANTVTDSSACPVCTFINHPSLNQCEMCGANLPREIVPTSTTSSSSCSSTNNNSLSSSSKQIRLSFRKGGQSSFLSSLKGALSAKQWEKISTPTTELTTPTVRGVGISAIEDRIHKTTLEANETMTDAFQDLDRLMMKATEMVKLAEAISNKVSKDPTNEDNEMSTLRTHLLNLGIASPVTKGSAGSIYHQELSRELADFLAKFFQKEDDMKSLTDVYCLFNRARGTALISPEDLYKASQQFEQLKLPFRLRKFPSGLLVIQSIDMNDNRAASRVLRHVKEQGGGLTALQLAEIEKLALAVAVEQLDVTEKMGLICRDEGPTGLSFYENLFLVSTST